MGLISIAGMILVVGVMIGLLALVAAPIVLALFLVGLVLKLIFFVLLLPFRLVGALFGIGFSALGWLARGAAVLLGVGLLLVLGILPLLPFLLIALGVYLVLRGTRSRSTPVAQA